MNGTTKLYYGKDTKDLFPKVWLFAILISYHHPLPPSLRFEFGLFYLTQVGLDVVWFPESNSVLVSRPFWLWLLMIVLHIQITVDYAAVL